MNLEMPSPAEADSLRTILLIVLGVMILTIPVVCVIVVSKVVAQRKQRAAPGKPQDRPGQEARGAVPVLMAGDTHKAPHTDSSQDDSPYHSRREVEHSPADDADRFSSGSESFSPDSIGGSSSDGGGSSSDSGGSSGSGDSGGGDGSD